MRTIAVIARKGGSGKTTVAVHMAIAAHLRGLKTLLADSDPQRSSSDVLKVRRGPGPAWLETAGPKLFALQVAAQRAAVDALVIDTAAGAEDELAHAIVLADLSLLVIRPTFLDFAAAVRTAEVVRRLHKPGIIVLNQAPVAREGVEPPAVKKAQEALRLMRPCCAPGRPISRPWNMADPPRRSNPRPPPRWISPNSGASSNAWPSANATPNGTCALRGGQGRRARLNTSHRPVSIPLPAPRGEVR